MVLITGIVDSIDGWKVEVDSSVEIEGKGVIEVMYKRIGGVQNQHSNLGNEWLYEGRSLH